MRLGSLWLLPFALLTVAACATEDDIYGVPLQNDAALKALKGPAGFATDPCTPVPSLPADFLDALNGCCGGKGKCVPEGPSMGKSGDQLPTCEQGGKCVPIAVLQASKTPPKACKTANGPGVCFPTCIDAVDRLKLVLPQEHCDADERCVPCVNPTDGTETGLCDLGKPQEKPATCVNKAAEKVAPEVCRRAKPIVDVNKLKACDAGHCIPKAAASGEMVSQLEPCADPEYVCAPDPFISTGGLFVPKTCASLGGAEGRCFSAAIGEVKEQGDRLPQDVCEKNERCTPCYDPVSGDPLPSCGTPCDAGPTQPAHIFAGCGKDRGRCVPESALGGGMMKIALKQDTCAKAEKCAPLSAIKRDAVPKMCKTKGLFSSGATGICMEAVFSNLVSSLGSLLGVSQADCEKEFLCVPCDLGGGALKGCPAKEPTASK